MHKQFQAMTSLPLFELPLRGGDYLIVELSTDEKGVYFSFDSGDKPLHLSSNIESSGCNHRLQWDDCLTLDEHLQDAYQEVLEGFIIPNDLYSIVELDEYLVFDAYNSTIESSLENNRSIRQ